MTENWSATAIANLEVLERAAEKSPGMYVWEKTQSNHSARVDQSSPKNLGSPMITFEERLEEAIAESTDQGAVRVLGPGKNATGAVTLQAC